MNAAAAGASGARAPRGQNKSKILESLKDARNLRDRKETGISTGTASATLTKMAKAGEIGRPRLRAAELDQRRMMDAADG